MKNLNKCYLALVVAAAIGISGCGSDGNDGVDGANGANGADGANGGNAAAPTVVASQETNVKLISYAAEEGQVRVEFEITDEAGLLVEGLAGASAYLAALTENGIQRSRAGDVGGAAYIGGAGGSRNPDTEGASLTMTEAGQYVFVAPMAAVHADTDGIVRLQVGLEDGAIAESREIIIHKPEGLQTTTATATCYTCHVDYATSDLKHSSHVGIDAEGEVDFVTGCMVCHNNVAQAKDEAGVYSGGYAKNTMQKIGHINHQEFETGFAVSNCFTCHAEPIVNVYSQQTCNDCHDALATSAPAKSYAQSTFVNAASDMDYRQFHTQAAKRSEIRATYSSTVTPPYWDKDATWDEVDRNGVPTGTVILGGVCMDIGLSKTVGEVTTELNLNELLVHDGEVATEEHYVTYAGGYIHGYDSAKKTIVGRAISHGAEHHIAREDGTFSECFPGLVGEFKDVNLNASSRITIAAIGQDGDDAGYNGVTLHGYSDAVSTDYYYVDPTIVEPTFEAAGSYERRLSVSSDSCSTCHNDVTNYHKNGAFADGGIGCVACHNNGQDRRAKYSAPGFGPMVHSMHWGIGNELSGANKDDEGNNVANSAANLNAANCVSCHDKVVDLTAVPNQYIRARAFNGGDTTKMASPITANCFACHDNDQALNHMTQNGGDISVDNDRTDGAWITQPTGESCATCHAEGRAYGIENYHVFTR
jgi:OmcA/MtrC family decaheme c-type cytochrome